MEVKLMRSVQYSTYGDGVASLQQVEAPIPIPKADEVLLKVEATSLNPADWKIQKGMIRPFLPRKFPFTPGTDVAGEVVQVGSGVSKFEVGDKVIASLHLVGGGLAEYAVAKESLTAKRPQKVSAAPASGLPIAGLTAHQALTQVCGIKLDGTGESKNILITAASGGVGHYAVQLAKLGNTHVTATCGARNIDLVKSLGADEVMDYKTPEGAALKSPSGKEYDYVINLAPGIRWSTFEANLSRHGKVIDLCPGMAFLWTFAVKKITFSEKQLVTFMMVPKAENLEVLVDLVEEEKLKTVVHSSYPLREIEVAWEKIVSGHATGKIIVKP